MLIRSQNKRSLFNLDRMENIQINKEQEQYTVAIYFTEDDMATVGRYSTEEKAIKALDMIQDYHINIANVRCRVFQMPQDSEVS